MVFLVRRRKFILWLGILFVTIPGATASWSALFIKEPFIPYLIDKAGGVDMSNNIWLIALPFVLMAIGALLLFLIWKQGKHIQLGGIDMSNEQEEKEKPTVIKDTEIKLDAKDTEKATGVDISTPTELDNVKVDVTAENVKDVTGVNVTAVNKEFAMKSVAIICSCGERLSSVTTHGYKPTIICPKCGTEYKG